MGNVCDVAEQFSVVIHGLDHDVFGHVDAAAIRVIVNDHIAWLDVLGSDFGY